MVDSDGDVIPLSTEDRETIVKEVVQPMAASGLRTLCIAYKDYVIGASGRLVPGGT